MAAATAIVFLTFAASASAEFPIGQEKIEANSTSDVSGSHHTTFERELNESEIAGQCVKASIRAIELEMERVEGWIANNNDPAKTDKFNKKLIFLREEINRYQSIDPVAYNLKILEMEK